MLAIADHDIIRSFFTDNLNIISATMSPILLDNGDSYEGPLLNKQKHGYGVYNYANGDTYTGDWVQDMQNGHGVYLYANGSRYEG